MDFPILPLPFWGTGPRHWLHRSVYDDEDFFFHDQSGRLLAAAGSTAIHGKKLFGFIPLTKGADVLISVADETGKYWPTVGFHQRIGDPVLSGGLKRQPMTDGEGGFAGELNWNGSTGLLYNADGLKLGSVSAPNPLRRQYRIHGHEGQKLCMVTMDKYRDLPESIPLDRESKPTVLKFAADQGSSIDVRLLAACMQVIPLMNA